jgi:acetyl esterase/lipase
VATGGCLGAMPPSIALWPGAAPGETGKIGVEHDITKAGDPLTGGRPVVRLGDISTPTISVFRPPAEKDTGAAVLVCPGGGYYILAYDLEGSEVCEWLNSIGVTGVLLKYRVPRREGLPRHAVALQDAQRAMGLVRSHAKEWGIDPNRLGVLGFSAGGHLCTVLSASEARTYPRVDEADDLSCHPNFQILVYPAYLLKDVTGYVLGPEVAVTPSTPPTFMVMTEDDPEHPEDVLAYAMELKRQKVPMELHLYPTGGHGYGLRPTNDLVTTWPQRAADWLRNRGLLAHN